MEAAERSIVILAAGQYPSHPLPLHALHTAHFVVCCDSAYTRFAPQEGQGFIVVGDGDSLPQGVKHGLGDRWVQVCEQDYNDLTKAMRWATERFGISGTRYTIVGATGLREDHTLGNIGLLAYYVRHFAGIEVEMLTDYGTFTPFEGRRCFESFAGQQVSLFATNPQSAVYSTGMKWELHGQCLQYWWQGTLNEALGDRFTLECESMIAYRTHEAKV